MDTRRIENVLKKMGQGAAVGGVVATATLLAPQMQVYNSALSGKCGHMTSICALTLTLTSLGALIGAVSGFAEEPQDASARPVENEILKTVEEICERQEREEMEWIDKGIQFMDMSLMNSWHALFKESAENKTPLKQENTDKYGTRFCALGE